jgi:hypothetical protein
LEASDDEGVCGRIVSLIPRTATAAHAILALCIPTGRQQADHHADLARQGIAQRRQVTIIGARFTRTMAVSFGSASVTTGMIVDVTVTAGGNTSLASASETSPSSD